MGMQSPDTRTGGIRGPWIRKLSRKVHLWTRAPRPPTGLHDWVRQPGYALDGDAEVLS